MYNLFMLKRLIMKKLLRNTVATVLCILSFTFILPVANAETNDTLKGMTLKEKIGQMITVEIRSFNNKNFTEMNSQVSKIISDTGIGGVTLFSENFSSTEQAVKLTTDLQKSALKSKNKIPLMISTDQEGGYITRLNTGTSLPGNMALGAINEEKYAKQCGEIIGSELSALGINTAFAPSLDINSNPENPIIGTRSFSSNPEIVKNLGNAMIQGIMDNYVVPTVKHFPGHGDTTEDSHTELPTVDKNLQELLECELVPFMSAIPMGVDMVMTAHIQFPQIDDTKVKNKDGKNIVVPATLSKKIVTDILRNQIGFNGIVITDAMNMDAIKANFEMADACIMAINAGVDSLLMPVSITDKNSGNELKSLINQIAKAVESGKIPEKRINQSVKRILDVKEKYGILSYSAPSVENALAVVGSKEHHETEADISAKAITVLKNEGNILPFKPKKNSKIVLVSAYENELPLFDYSMNKLNFSNVKYQTYCYNSDKKATILNAVKKAEYIVVLAEMNTKDDLPISSTTTKMTRSIMNTAKLYKKKCAVISANLPYDTANYTDAQALLCSYGCNGMDDTDTDPTKPTEHTYGPNIIGAMEVIFGNKTPQGKLPVDVPSVKDNKIDTKNLAFEQGFGLDISEKQPTTEETKIQSTTETTIANTNAKTDTKEENLLTKNNVYGYIFVVGGCLVAILLIAYVIACIKSSKKKNNNKH